MDKVHKWGGFVLSGMAFFASVGALYQAVATARERRKYPAPGQMANVNGHRLHLHCTGSGSPTVVIDSGLGMFSPDWCLVQPGVAEFTRVCIYDRAGYGWSEPGPMPRTSRQMVKELHSALVNANVQEPYVLVGYSLGGLNARLYAHHYPEEVAGVVLVDSAHEDVLVRLPPEFRRVFTAVARLKFLIAVLACLGITRVMARWLPPVYETYFKSKVPQEMYPLFLTPRFWPQYLEAVANECAGVEESFTQLRATGSDTIPPLGDKALVVLTASVERSALEWRSLFDFPAEAFKQGWMELQTDLARLSSNCTHIIAERGGHGSLLFEQPDLVVEAICQVVRAVRKGQ